jgi:hypothetical protein
MGEPPLRAVEGAERPRFVVILDENRGACAPTVLTSWGVGRPQRTRRSGTIQSRRSQQTRPASTPAVESVEPRVILSLGAVCACLLGSCGSGERGPSHGVSGGPLVTAPRVPPRGGAGSAPAAASPRGTRGRCLRGQDVPQARPHLQRGVHALDVGALHQPPRVVQQQLVLPDLHHEGRQAAQVGVQQRRQRVLWVRITQVSRGDRAIDGREVSHGARVAAKACIRRLPSS